MFNNDFIIGTLSKISELLITHPLIILKNDIQTKRKFNSNILYRGLGINVINMGCITGTKFYLYDYLIYTLSVTYNISKLLQLYITHTCKFTESNYVVNCNLILLNCLLFNLNKANFNC